MIHFYPLSPNQRVESGMPKSWPLRGQILQPTFGFIVVVRFGFITKDTTTDAHQLTGPPLAYPKLVNPMVHNLSTSLGPYQFFESTSFKAIMSTACCATTRRSLLFSASSSLRRFGSLGCMSPYFFASNSRCNRLRRADGTLHPLSALNSLASGRQ